MNMAQRIKQARIKKGYNQEYVAQMLGVSRQAVSKWESGKSQPDTKNLIALSNLLDTGVDQLIGSNSEPLTVSSPKSKFLRRISLILLITALIIGVTGFVSGEYSTMLFIPVSETGSIGIPFIWYGISTAAICLKIGELLFLTLSILIRIIAWSIHSEKQALS